MPFQENYAVEGIRLDMLEPDEILTSAKVLRKMKRLRLIMVRNLHVSGCPEYLSNDLIWLDLHGKNLSHSGCVQEAAPLEDISGKLLEEEYMVIPSDLPPLLWISEPEVCFGIYTENCSSNI